MINSRNIDDLLPRTAARCREFIKACAAQGIDVIITSTYRDVASQNALYAQGRTTLGSKVTNVQGGRSFHNHRVAFDFVPLVNGKAMWSDNDLWSRCGWIGELIGLEWGGSWEHFPDRPHMQDTGGYSVDQYLRGEVKS